MYATPTSQLLSPNKSLIELQQFDRKLSHDRTSSIIRWKYAFISETDNQIGNAISTKTEKYTKKLIFYKQ